MSPMEETMQTLETMKDIELPMDPAYYDALHARIMNAVDRAHERAPTRPPAAQPWYAKPKDVLRAHFKSWLTIGGGLSGFVLAAHLGAIMVAKTLHQSQTVIAALANDDEK